MNKLLVRYILIISCLFVFPIVLSGQEKVTIKRSENKIILEGKVYYVHVVKQGHTLYSIAKTYNVSEKEIVIQNPGVTEDLIIGQVLKIPSNPESTFNVDTAEEQDKKYHIIKEGETVYSISRMYNCTREEILQLNPELDINDIPVGTKIMLPSEDPRNELSYDEEGFIMHKVKSGETLYSIKNYYGVTYREIKAVNPNLRWGKVREGEVIKIPQSNIAITEMLVPDTIEFEPDIFIQDTLKDVAFYDYEELKESVEELQVIKVAYLIPFNYEEMEPLDSLLKDVKSLTRINRIKEDYLIEEATPKSVSFLEFLEGSFLAIDSLSDSGPKFDIRVYDTKRSMHHTRNILDNPEMKEVDLIIGPFYDYNLELVSDFAYKNKIPVVTPFYSNDALILNNPYLFQVTPSYKTEFLRNAEYIARSHDKNLILVHEGDSSEMEKVDYYKKVLINELEKYSAEESVIFKEVVLEDGDMSELIQALNPIDKNLVILPATDEAFSSQIARTLYYQLDSCDVELFGSSYWPGYKNIDISYIHALNLKISSCFWFDYSDPSLLFFLNKYRQNYFKEPEFYTRRGINYGVAGYDISMYFLSALKNYGKRFILHLDEISKVNTITQYNFSKVSANGGFSNVNMKYYLFGEELIVHTIDLPSRPPLHHYLQPANENPFFFLRSKPVKDSIDHINLLNFP